MLKVLGCGQVGLGRPQGMKIIKTCLPGEENSPFVPVSKPSKRSGACRKARKA